MPAAALSLAYALFVYLVALGKLKGPFAVDRDVWNFVGLALITLAYTALQGTNAIWHALPHTKGRTIAELFASFIPLAIVAYALAVFQYATPLPTTFQVAAVVFATAAALIDILFWYVSARIGRVQNEEGQLAKPAPPKPATS